MKMFFTSKITRRLVLILTMIFFVINYYGAVEGRKRMSNRVVDWLPAGFEETGQFYWFLSHFSDGSLLMASWDGCSPRDERLDVVAQRLTTPEGEESTSLFRKVMTSANVYETLTGDPLNLDPPEAFDRMKGWVLSHDEAQGALIAFFSPDGNKNPAKAIARLYQVIEEEFQLPQNAIRLAGPSRDSSAIDQASITSQRRLLPFFLSACVVILLILLRTWIGVFAVFIAAVFNEELCAALIYFTGSGMDSVSLLSSSLIFVLTVSGTLHLLNYYRDVMERSGSTGAMRSAIRKAFLPCSLACLTTVLGLFSLTISRVVPIRNFGIYATASLILGTLFFFVFVGSFIEEYPIQAWRQPRVADRARSCLGQMFSMENLWDRLPSFVQRRRLILIALCLVPFVFLAFCLPRLQTIITFHGMFPKDAPVIRDYQYLEDRIGGLIPLEVAVNIPSSESDDAEATPVSRLAQITLLEKIHDELCSVEGIDSSLSALNFIPFVPEGEGSGFTATVERSVFNKIMNGQLDHFRQNGLFDDRVTERDQIGKIAPADRWRISLRVRSDSGIQYGPFLKELKQTADSVIAQNESELGLNGTTALITGGIPLAHKAQRQLFDDLASSYCSAFFLILLTLIFLFRGLLPGIIAMIPNIFPSVLVFGTMAFLDIPVDMGMMMTASVALGISVDGTIHFLTWYRQGLAFGKTQEEAIQFAYRECGTAMVQATFICGGGMLVFALSRFLPISRFASMMAILLTVALIGDLILLPALLNGWAGHCFMPKKLRRKNNENLTAPHENNI